MEIKSVNYEKALNYTGFSRYNLRIFFFCGFVTMAQVFEVFSLVFLAPASACDFQTTSKQQDLMIFLSLLVVLISGHTLGYLGDTKGRRKVLVKCSIFGFIVSACSTLSPNWIVLSVLKCISAAFMGSAHFQSQLLLSECTPRAQRKVLVMLSTSIFLVAFGLMAVISIPILSITLSFYIPLLGLTFNAWRVLGLIYSLPSFVSAIAISRVFESPKYLHSIGNKDKALEVLTAMYVINTGKSRDDYKVQSLFLDEVCLKTEPKGIFRSVLARTMPIFKSPFRILIQVMSNISLFFFACVMVLVKWLISISHVFISSIANGDTNLTLCSMMRKYQNIITQEEEVCTINSSAVTIVFGVSMFLAVLNLVVSGLLNSVGRKKLLIGIQSLSGIALLFTNISNNWILTAVLFVIYLSGVINYGVIMSYIIDIFPTYIASSAICLLMLMGYAHQRGILEILSRFFNNHCETVIYIFGSLICLAALLGLLLPTDEKIIELKKPKDKELLET